MKKLFVPCTVGTLAILLILANASYAQQATDATEAKMWAVQTLQIIQPADVVANEALGNIPVRVIDKEQALIKASGVAKTRVAVRESNGPPALYLTAFVAATPVQFQNLAPPLRC